MNILKLGSKGGDVKVLQEYLCLTADGDFGKKTEAAVKTFQRIRGLKEDGIVGNNTWLMLIKEDLRNDFITNADYIKAAIELNCELATIKAVKTVESGGKGIQNGIPTMLFEGHIFWSELKKKGIDPNKYVKGNENILYPTWVKTHYTGKNTGEYQRLLKAIKINEDAAYRSASYGLFQIMGNNCKTAGYNTAKEFFNALSKNEDAHLTSFVSFLKNSGITPYLQKKDWQNFAKRYNGPGYAKNQYDKKLEQAYNKYK